jgi:hypothetical protein
MQATSQEVQDELGLLRKLMVSICLLIETRQVLPLAKDRKSVELHGRKQIFFFDKTSTSDFIASQGTSVQGMEYGLDGIWCKDGHLHGCLKGIQCLEHHRSLSHQK